MADLALKGSSRSAHFPVDGRIRIDPEGVRYWKRVSMTGNASEMFRVVTKRVQRSVIESFPPRFASFNVS